MGLVVSPSERERLAAQVLMELRAKRARDLAAEATAGWDIVRWIENNFYVPGTGKLAILQPHQKCLLRLMFKLNDRHKFSFTTLIYSTIKKSGKSTIAGMIARWMAETQVRYGEIMAIGNDRDQAKSRSFREIKYSIEMAPGFDRQRRILANRWNIRNELTQRCLMTGTEIKAIAVDAKGEAGGKQALSIWTELWGFEYEDALRFWEEMTPVPTEPISLRMVETYAGYDGESDLLFGLYQTGLNGRHLTARDLALAGMSDYPGESYEELHNAFHETKGDPDAHVRVWVNDNASLFMYWDDGVIARRMPWQQGEDGEQYYRDQEAILPPNAFLRLHHNLWVGAESQFVPIEKFDACYDKSLPPLLPGDRTPIVLGVDAASTNDCFAIVAVSRHPTRNEEVAVRAYKKWDPREEGGRIDYDEPEQFIVDACAQFNVVQVCYDPYQLENMSQRLRKKGVVWMSQFTQQQDRLKADRNLYDMIIQGTFHHNEDPHGARSDLRQHVLNSNAKLEKDQDSKMRIIKKAGNRKIDLTVATSMAVARCMYLLL